MQKKAGITGIVSPGQYVRILAKQGEKAVDVKDASKESGAAAVLASVSENESQIWQLAAQDGFYKLVNKASGKVLDVMLAGTANGAYLHQWDGASGDTQLWSVTETDDGFCKLANKASGKVLDIAGMTDAEGANLQIWEDVDGEFQQWKLCAVESAAKEAKPAQAEKPEPEKQAPAESKPEPVTSTVTKKKSTAAAKKTTVKAADKPAAKTEERPAKAPSSATASKKGKKR